MCFCKFCMKTSRFTDSQIIAILKLAEAGSPVPELCREHGMSTATFYKWHAKFGGMDASLIACSNFQRSRHDGKFSAVDA
jgi:putative transposase